MNDHPEALSRAILERLPLALRGANAQIRWLSPLATDDFREYRDAEFLDRVGLGRLAKALAQFWPKGGPSWDALGLIVGDGDPSVVLVEAKSHIPEIYGNGCQASPPARVKIAAALRETQRWCGVGADKDWLGCLYQSANRLAHLYFLLECARVPAWLVNLYFVDDSIGPTSAAEWEAAAEAVKSALGLSATPRNAIGITLPALAPATTAISFAAWRRRWDALAEFTGPQLPDPAGRIEAVLHLWDEAVPGIWQRNEDLQLHGPRYRRGDAGAPHPGEHTIEHEILVKHFDAVCCLGGRLVDGVNAMPLVRDGGGGRRYNVEADLMLLVGTGSGYCLVVCEVKAGTDDAWSAAIQNLRQLKLLQQSRMARELFHRRNPRLGLPPALSASGLVVAPAAYYSAAGRKANAVAPAMRLLRAFAARTGTGADLAIWNPMVRRIEPLA